VAATAIGLSGRITTNRDWQLYCKARFKDYRSCMFSREDLCFAVRYVSEPPVHTKQDWSELSGWHPNLDPKKHPNLVKDGRKVTAVGCDPRPPGSERH
jgi:hypothetical protein